MLIFNKHKWLFIWGTFFLFLVGFVIYAVICATVKDLNLIIIQIAGMIFPLFAAVIIMLQNNEQIEISTKTQIEHLQDLNNKQIKAFSEFFQKQIDTIESNTNKQIKHYGEQTEKVINELSENSNLLAEILMRQLEEAILEFETKLKGANDGLNHLNAFHLLRTDIAKNQQVAQQKDYIKYTNDWLNYLRVKYKKVKDFLNKND